eukprot:6193144-Pleurochrysis_carterae.AAC.2
MRGLFGLQRQEYSQIIVSSGAISAIAEVLHVIASSANVAPILTVRGRLRYCYRSPAYCLFSSKTKQSAALCLRWLAKVHGHHPSIVAAGSIAALVAVARTGGPSHTGSTSAALAVEELICSKVPAEAVVADGDIKALLHAVRGGHLSFVAAARTLSRLADHSISAATAIVTAGGVTPIAALLGTNPALQESARALQSIAVNDEITAALADAGCIGRFVAMVAKHHAVALLRQLAQHKCYRQELVNEGAIYYLVRKLTRSFGTIDKAVVDALADLMSVKTAS